MSEDRLHATIARLVGFGTRHTLSDTRSNRRGIGAARRWVESEFRTIGAACGGCLEIATPSESVTGTARVPTPTEIVDVLAIQRGTSDPGRVIIISAHLDSRVSDVMNARSDAPGANDDASGVAAVKEAARVLSRHRFRATLVYAALSGEEQGLHGGAILARYAREQGWRVEAVLNNDIMGNTEGMNSHWRESVATNELMTGFLNTGSNPRSAITVGSLRDQGYLVNGTRRRTSSRWRRSSVTWAPRRCSSRRLRSRVPCSP